MNNGEEVVTNDFSWFVPCPINSNKTKFYVKSGHIKKIVMAFNPFHAAKISLKEMIHEMEGERISSGEKKFISRPLGLQILVSISGFISPAETIKEGKDFSNQYSSEEWINTWKICHKNDKFFDTGKIMQEIIVEMKNAGEISEDYNYGITNDPENFFKNNPPDENTSDD